MIGVPGRNSLRKGMKDVGYGGNRAGAPAAAGSVDVPIMAEPAPAPAPAAAAVKEKTPTAPQSRTAPNVRRAQTAEPKPSPLPHPPHCAALSEHSKPTFAKLRRMKDHGRSSAVLTPSTSHPRRICYTRSADLMKKNADRQVRKS